MLERRQLFAHTTLEALERVFDLFASLLGLFPGLTLFSPIYRGAEQTRLNEELLQSLLRLRLLVSSATRFVSAAWRANAWVASRCRVERMVRRVRIRAFAERQPLENLVPNLVLV
jgi:hypothetical protein